MRAAAERGPGGEPGARGLGPSSATFSLQAQMSSFADLPGKWQPSPSARTPEAVCCSGQSI